MRFPARSLWILSRRIRSGEVVFFVGSGFSVDSEGNSTDRLILRLLIRFEALTAHLAQIDAGVPGAERIRERAVRLRRVLRNTFRLGKDHSRPLATRENAEALKSQYFTFNDWICSAFTALLGDCKRISHGAGTEPEEVRKALAALQQALCAREEEIVQPPGQAKPLDEVPLDRPDLACLLDLEGRDRGKALFLDTMGFANEKIMGGPLLSKELEMRSGNWEGRILDRHHVLARLAREGLCPTILTTNYDLLLEWACRLNGLQPAGVKDPRRLLPPTTVQSLVRVSRAQDFFRRGGAHRAALIAKIHGCSDAYRDHRKSADSWHDYLPSLIFTFREIQNWREDAWSRDFLQTLLRTRTLVFCGYSGTDPVVHDTVRTVYEEMARKRKGKAPARRTSHLAPAYYLGLADTDDFHGMEILRAATQALGEDLPELTDHPNYLRFFLRGEPSFPRMDELMTWLFHLVFRRCQVAALEADLRRIATLLLGHPCPPSELRTIRRHFLRLLWSELRAARGWDETAGCRRQLERITGWTDRFQVGLLREMALAETVLRNQGPGADFEHLRNCPWYFPALERTDWTAWAAVVEIAARRMIAAWRNTAAWWADSDWVRPGREGHPAILFSQGKSRPTPVELSIRLASFQRSGAGVHGAVRRRTLWELHPEGIPWCTDRHGQISPFGTPDAHDLWDWAVRDLGPGPAPELQDKDRTDLDRWLLGETDEHNRREPAA